MSPSRPSRISIRRLSIRQRLLLAVAVMTAALLAGSLLQLHVLQRYRIGGPTHALLKAQREARERLTLLLVDLNGSYALVARLQQSGSHERAALLRRQLTEQADAIDLRFERALEDGTLGDSRPLIVDARTTWRQLRNALRVHLTTPGAATLLSDAESRRYARLVEQIESASNAMYLQYDEVQAQSERALRHELAITLLAVLALAAFWLFVLFRIARSFTVPLRALVSAAQQVGQGDLSVQLPETAEDELGQLAAGLGQMLGRLRELHLTLRTTVAQLGIAVEHMAAASSEQERQVTIQATSLQETLVSAQVLRESSGMAAARATQLLGSAVRAEEVGLAGTRALDESLGGIQHIGTHIEAIARQVVELGERTAEVGTITQAVKDVAEQSHVLALSASIEAARAGEVGRGFAVVAQEMRSLAERSVKATSEVRRVLLSTADAVRSAVQLTEQGQAQMKGSLAQVGQSSARLRELGALLQEASLGIRQVAGAVGEQDAGIGMLSGAVGDLASGTTVTMASLEATRAAVQLLQDVSAQVDAALQTLRL
ncbi:methyl-accepting chemotaxis protein [Aggregicoccus sp. 17bor-14]|uniref:methyl-accepting chemotaxis protein n=1 Tax=Myxococcaceae TaxID=31 RepID=UPI00129C9B39|nr:MULTISPECIES: methyl-accepting chemotaxis protein [Myxococcaceae]MBF5045959.1 methyl-accepting chemotaxis protein [Simulacricoccus sp. 17bor-14]MRI91691.1 methyl-accepting chemotaxis protein [Aggregicoccus sp. 17bor-14]